MITPKQQYSVFNLLPPSGNYGSNNMQGFEGLDRMRNFNMRRNSQDQINGENGEEHTNPRGSLTPGLNFDQYNPNGLALLGNILPLPDLQNNNLYAPVG